ncbi:MAG: hypothetical protein AAFY76_00200 [Cyanobacteria bacterium J06649_11]
MNVAEVLFHDLFLYLKDDLKVELDFVQYEQFIHIFLSDAWRGGIVSEPMIEKNTQIKEALRTLCIALWVPRRRYLDAFNTYFDQLYNDFIFRYLGQQIDTLSRQTEVQISKNKEHDWATSTIDSPDLNTTPTEDKVNVDETTKPTDKPNSIGVFIDITHSKKGGSFAPVKKEEKASLALDTSFIFSDNKHLPVANRRSLQLWRKLNSVSQKIEGNRIDVKNTVQRLSKERILLHPINQLEKKGALNTILFIEHMGAMVAFQSWWKQLINHLTISNEKGSIKVYYFNNYPLPVEESGETDFCLFLNESHTSYENYSEIKKDVKKDTLVLFFSDAGALDFNKSIKKINHTLEFIEQLQLQSQRLLWLNPIPQAQWNGTSAKVINLLIPMVTYDLSGLEKGIKMLRSS